MKQVRIEHFGAPSVVAKCVDVPDVGEPSAWEVVVDIEAFPINVADLAMISGHYGYLPKPPTTIGMEAAGRVTAVGTDVKDLDIGDRVVLLANDNWSQRRRVPAATVHRVSPESDPLQVAMLKVNPSSAMLMLTEFVNLKPGDWIIQTAPLSSVGQCIIQIARQRGFRTVSILRNEARAAAVLALGGDIAIVDGPNLPQRIGQATGGAPVTLALDAVGGPGINTLALALCNGGQLVNYGMLGGEACCLDCESTIFRNISLKGFWLSRVLNRLSAGQRSKLFRSLHELVASRALRMEVDSCFPIEEITSAIRRAEAPDRKGRVLVLPNGKIGV